MTTDRQRQLSDELRRVEFEFFKHMTTLSGAAVLVILAVYGGFSTDRLALTAALLTFAAAALVSVLGMWLGCYQLRILAQGGDEYQSLSWALVTVYGLFTSGIVSFALNTVISTWLRIGLGLAVAAVLGTVVVVKLVRDARQ